VQDGVQKTLTNNYKQRDEARTKISTAVIDALQTRQNGQGCVYLPYERFGVLGLAEVANCLK
jgi:hypothetical protein